MTSLDLLAHDATGLSEMVRCGEVAARSVIEATLRRIDRLDGRINAYRVVMSDSALADARRIDELADAERASLPMAGVPVAIKDDTDVEGQTTAWGSAADRGSCAKDSDVVARLRAAGAVIIGKTNVPELALWPWTSSGTLGCDSKPLVHRADAGRIVGWIGSCSLYRDGGAGARERRRRIHPLSRRPHRPRRLEATT